MNSMYHAFALDIHTGREQPHVLYRHAVRKWYRDRGYTLRMICLLELEVTGDKPDHSTIIHSCRVAADKHIEMVRIRAELYGITA
jgi:hypothetical protein